MTIFISVASYRDPELLPTIVNCVTRSRWPGDLRFGVCQQHGDDEHLLPSAIHAAKVRVLDVPHQESEGACWARSRIERELYDGEDYFLQIDSHHRFVQDWDAILISQYARTGAARAVLSSYVGAYDIDKPTRRNELPTCMRLDRMETTGVVLFLGFPVSWARSPVKARFISGHFLFSIGHFATEVPYDPELYFTGEEMTIALRAYTHGYDLFHPSEHVVWHEYTRKARIKHWDDHLQHKGAKIPWHVRDSSSKTKVLRMLKGEDIGPYGFGTVRNLRDYEHYSGLNFTNWTACPAAFKGDAPA